MSTLLDELRADQGKPTQCVVCRWIETLSPGEQQEWDTACADRAFTHSSIFRALHRRESGVKRGSVENHRTNKHRQPKS